MTVDIISSLLDAILCHILSFLDTKCAVGYIHSIHKMERGLHLSVPNIILDDSLSGKDRKQRTKKSVLKFAKFGVRKIMIRDVPYIDLFRLKCHFGFKNPAIQTLVFAAVCHNIREVDIWVEKPEYAGVLLPELFTCRSLVILKLRGEFDLGVLEFVSLPNLEVLVLDDLILLADDSMRRLFKGCEVLDGLWICRCGFERVEVLDISIPSLTLIFLNCGGDDMLDYMYYYSSIKAIELVIDTPNLKYLEYQAHDSLEDNLESLGIAEISFISYVENRDNVLRFVNKMQSLKSLYLSDNAVEVKLKLHSLLQCSKAHIMKYLPRAFSVLLITE